MLDFAAQALGLVAQLDRLAPGFLGDFPLALGDLAVIFRVCDHVLEADILLGKQRLGPVDQPFGEAELSGDIKGVALAWNADGQAIGGPEGFDVKFHACVLHAGSAQGKGLELAVVGGGHGAHLTLQQAGKNALRKRRALGGVGARAQLVKEHQVVVLNAGDDLHDIGHVRGEGTQ